MGFLFTERSGCVAAIVCDTTGNTVRQGYCYICLVIGGGVFSRAGRRGVSNVGFPNLSFLVCPFLGLSLFFWGFPDLSRDCPWIFPITPCSRPVNSTWSGHFPKKVGTAQFGNSPDYLLSDFAASFRSGHWEAPKKI